MKYIEQVDAEFIRLTRRSKGLSQEDVAKGIGVAQVTISAWEKGKQQPQPAALAKLSRLLEVPVDRIKRAPSVPAEERKRFSLIKTNEELEAEFYEALVVIVSTMKSKAGKKTIQSTVREIVKAWSLAVFGQDRPPPPSRTDYFPENAKLICNLCGLEVGTLPKGSCEECGLSCGWSAEL